MSSCEYESAWPIYSVLFVSMCLFLSLSLYIYIYIGWVQVTLGVTLSNVIQLNIFKLDTNFDKLTIELDYLYIFFMFAKFKVIKDQ